MKKLNLTTVAFAAFIGPAFAADMPVKAPIFNASAPVNWTGCYVGANIGGLWNHLGETATFSGNRLFNQTFSGWVGGGQIGCDYQFSNNWVIGIQGMADASRVKGNTPDLFAESQSAMAITMGASPNSIDVQNDWFSTVALELGYLINPTLKFYGKAGYGWLQETQTYNCGLRDCTGNPPPGPLAPVSLTRSGIDVGLGLSWMFQRNWDLFVEYDHTWLRTQTIMFPPPVGPYFVNPAGSLDRVLVGIDYRFGG
jgi:outer membrane immunogenic protein